MGLGLPPGAYLVRKSASFAGTMLSIITRMTASLASGNLTKQMHKSPVLKLFKVSDAVLSR